MRRFISSIWLAFGLFALSSGNAASAQTRSVSIEYDGVVKAGLNETLSLNPGIVQNGPLPTSYPYQPGDSFKMQFQVDLPSAAELAARTGGIGQFRFPIDATGRTGAPYGNVTNFEFSGPATISQSFPYNFSGLDMVYDGPTHAFYLDDKGGEWNFGPIDIPSLERLGSDEPFVVKSTSCFGVQCEQSNVAARLEGGRFNTFGIPVSERFQPNGAAAKRIGTFDLIAEGIWSLPFLSSLGSTGGGDPVDVPAPPMMLLFAMVAAGLAWRRRSQLQ